ncbi:MULTISPECIES: class F sortase [unclassified Streptomyces]|uniref:class F sortase n=1 Tax=unclassified Streptomyces TaxID=2593676 RepID=UPI002DDAFFF4|nr:class F sortase [Streptomyces sp. NBC_01750]WSB02577.1 class F sortase [Streptomyces sp. NBC_01794]WSD33154.1 class F sortase [Streptomyces sp. NBC_01750]
MSRTPHRRRRAAALPALACAGFVLATVAGCSADAVQTSPQAAKAPSAASPTTVEGKAADPAHIAIPSIGVDSSLMRLGLNDDRTVEVPPADKGMTAGWYTGGAVPGERGAAVIIGHNDTRFGRAVFHDLKKIAKGADIAVRTTRGTTLHFTVTGTDTVRKNAFLTQKVYGPTTERALRLITCAGDFDAQGHPVDNLIVYATLR